jgi:hypothetical protein
VQYGLLLEFRPHFVELLACVIVVLLGTLQLLLVALNLLGGLLELTLKFEQLSLVLVQLRFLGFQFLPNFRGAETQNML